MNRSHARSCFIAIMVLLLTAQGWQPASGQSAADSDRSTPASQKHKLVVGIAVQPPLCMQDEDGNWYGITAELWQQIANKLNLDFEYKKLDVQGLVKGMDDGSLDVVASPFFIATQDDGKMDFSAPYFVDDCAIAINANQQPTFAQAMYSTILSPGFLIILLVGALIAVGGATVLWLIEHRGKSEHYAGKDHKSFAKSLFWSISVLAGRDFPKTIGWAAPAPATVPGQAFGLVWMMLGVLLFSLFTAGAASLITSRQLKAIASNWSDLRHLRVGTVDDPDFLAFMKRQKIKPSIFADPDALLKGLTDHKVDAIVFGRIGLLWFAKTDYADKIVVLPITSQPSCMGLPMRIGSPLRRSINHALLQVTESSQWANTLSKYQ
jgi:polar amino acid transport system substrate-binding protein